MAKVGLTKLTPIKAGEVKTIIINDVEVAVKLYLPMQEKTHVIEEILNSSVDDVSDFGEVKLHVFTTIEILKAYTNISFTETQLKDIPKLYDLLVLNNVWLTVKDNIPAEELEFITTAIDKEAKRLSAYFHSAMGVLASIQQDYSATSMDVDGLINKIKDGESIELVKDILTKVN